MSDKKNHIADQKLHLADEKSHMADEKKHKEDKLYRNIGLGIQIILALCAVLGILISYTKLQSGIDTLTLQSDTNRPGPEFPPYDSTNISPQAILGGEGRIVFSQSSQPNLENGILTLYIPEFTKNLSINNIDTETMA